MLDGALAFLRGNMAMLKPKLKMSKPKMKGVEDHKSAETAHMHSAVEQQRKSELQMPRQEEMRRKRGYS